MNISSEYKIRKITPDKLDDFLQFFDTTAFADNKEWEQCYCVFWHHPGTVDEWMKFSKEDNRKTAIQLIQNQKLSGFIAYENERPIAFCNANQKELFTFNKTRVEIAESKDTSVVSIVCFIVAHTHRRMGVASSLLRAVSAHYKNTDIRLIEAYPAKTAEKDAQHYYGPLSLYLKNGFSIIREYDHYYIVQKRI
ncbi:MAG: GNAT family N-acetyltransferase [Spirochaetales bacterium]|nr:GNAT family N-acetyltransferase [Spirochaetales bacterium]